MCAARARHVPTWPALVILALLQALPVAARADEVTDFKAAVADATAQYHVALTTLETQSQDETEAEVERLRAALHTVADRFGSNRAISEDKRALFMQIDVRLVGMLLVIRMGNRDAARKGLEAIGDMLAELSATTASP
jgi:hypothetical protein